MATVQTVPATMACGTIVTVTTGIGITATGITVGAAIIPAPTDGGIEAA